MYQTGVQESSSGWRQKLGSYQHTDGIYSHETRLNRKIQKQEFTETKLLDTLNLKLGEMMRE